MEEHTTYVNGDVDSTSSEVWRDNKSFHLDVSSLYIEHASRGTNSMLSVMCNFEEA